MNSEEFLKRGCRLKLEIESKKEVLEELKTNLDGLQAIRVSEKVQGGPLPSDENMVNRINKIIEEEKKIEILYDFMADLSSEIDKVEDVLERAILRYRYITCLTWEQIAEKMGYCLSQVYRIHNRAFKNFNKINDTK